MFISANLNRHVQIMAKLIRDMINGLQCNKAYDGGGGCKEVLFKEDIEI